jgi:uncharacterized protein
MPFDVVYWLTYVAVGIFVGFLSGLLGIGGGSVLVPVLTLIWIGRGFAPDHIIHLAIGTSMAVMLIGSASSVRAHHRHGAVRWDVVRNMLPGLIAGGVIGTTIAHFASVHFLKMFFLAFMVFITGQMLFDVKPKPTRTLPGPGAQAVIGAGFSAISNLAGLGGAVPLITFMTWCNMRLQEAIGTAAAMVVPIAATGTVGYIITGMLADNLPPLSLGYVYLPALLGVSIASFIAAPFGARLTHRMPTHVLRKAFMVMLLALTIKMVVSI